MRITEVFKTRHEKMPDIAALEQAVAAAEGAADPGQRLLDYLAVERQSRALATARNGAYDRAFERISQAMMVVVLGGIVAATTAAIPAAVGAGIFAVTVCSYFAGAKFIYRACDQDQTLRASRVIAAGAKRALKYLAKADPLVFAASPRLVDVLQAIPGIREKFLLAAGLQSMGFPAPDSASPKNSEPVVFVGHLMSLTPGKQGSDLT